jgi:hypothetical protein
MFYGQASRLVWRGVNKRPRSSSRSALPTTTSSSASSIPPSPPSAPFTSPATTTIALRATLTLPQQTHTLGAAGRAALLDTHQATQKMRNHNWPVLLKRALEAINRRTRDALEKRLRLAVRSRTVVTAALLLDATTALAAHVDRAVHFTNHDSVQTNADLVRECLNEIRDDADLNLGTPVPWRECLPTAILDAHPLVTHLADWARTDATNEADVRAAFAADA